MRIRRSEVKKVYANEKQIKLICTRATKKMFLAGRGAGKTHAEGMCIYDYMRRMPRSKGALCGPTLTQIKSKFLPVILDVWTSLGLIEGYHYVMFKRPPAHWPKAYSSPQTYKNTITLCNGSCVELVNWQGRTAALGGNFDWAVFDEFLLCPLVWHDRDFLPTLRGNALRFTKEQGHFERCYFTSQPYLESQKHLIFRMEGEENVLWIESNAYDNIDAYGAEQIEEQLASLSPSEARVHILNERVGAISNAFYHSLSLDQHTYTEALKQGFKICNHYDAVQDLNLSWDFGGNICCLIMIQRITKDGTATDRVLDELFRKKGSAPVSLLDSLIDDFIERYRGHKGTLMLWGDRNGNNSRADDNRTYYQVITQKLQAAGFRVEKVVKGLDVLHAKKHYIINGLLSGTEKSVPVLINAKNCPFLLKSMQAAPITPDFKKDKSSERDPNCPQERATHLSDCFDNYFAKVGEAVIMKKLANDLRPMTSR